MNCCALQRKSQMAKRQVRKDLSITRFELAKRVLVFLGLAGFMFLNLLVTRSSPKTGWPGVAVFGVMTILAAVELVKIRDHKIIKGEGTGKAVRASLIWSGTVFLSVLFGLLGTVLSNLVVFRLPLIAVWLTTFISTLAFYPFRGEQTKDFPTFPLWAIYCALMGVVSLGVSYGYRWIN